jgi:hypothetical protein
MRSFVDEERYMGQARREAELAEAELERSRSAWLFALSQENEGMRDHFIRVAARARFAWSSHEEKARQLEARAAELRPAG